MEIISIFVGKLYSIHYSGEKENEWRRLLDLWSNTEYLYGFLNNNKSDLPQGYTIPQFAKEIIKDAEAIDEILKLLSKNKNATLNEFFKPLDNNEFKLKTLSKQKGRENYLRIYAIKINDDCFMITGGAIKLTQFMKDRNHTKEELKKLERCRDFLKSNDIFDEDSFYEYLIEQNDK